MVQQLPQPSWNDCEIFINGIAIPGINKITISASATVENYYGQTSTPRGTTVTAENYTFAIQILEVDAHSFLASLFPIKPFNFTFTITYVANGIPPMTRTLLGCRITDYNFDRGADTGVMNVPISGVATDLIITPI